MIMAADLFCGAGGSSTGLVQAAAKRALKIELLAVNHWPVAVETHARNHPWARHLCADLSQAALCEPFVVPMEHSGRQPVRGTDVPLPTITTARGGAFGLCQPFVIGQQSGAAPRSVDEPLPTIATAGAIAICQPFLTKYYGSGTGARPVSEPLDTITAKDRFALVEPTRMGIYFRMLKPHELAAAMGFDGYQFAGTQADQVRQIGNAVSVRTARALCGVILDRICAGAERVEVGGAACRG